MDEGIYYVVQRYNDLFDLLRDWGYDAVPDPDFESWQEIVRDGTHTGHVKLTGTRDNGDGTYLRFKFEEFWVKGDRGEEAVIVREDGSLWGYYYHGQAPNGGMRWCVDAVGHPLKDGTSRRERRADGAVALSEDETDGRASSRGRGHPVRARGRASCRSPRSSTC